MGSLPRSDRPREPEDCECEVCPDAFAEAHRINWGQCNPLFIRPRDEDAPAELIEAWEPAPEDREWAAQWNEEGCGPDDLSPEEEEILLWGEDEWVRACEEHARWMEEMEQEAAYHELLGRMTLGGFPAWE